ncbi:MAG: DUF423 domain-containing protein [Planctomyces sp.]|nr:DUF423 domain-containing protein [Planctomyces sp.]
MTGWTWVRVGACLAALAVALGAWAAHGLDKLLLEKYGTQAYEGVVETIPRAKKYVADFKTAAEYQMSHALGIILAGALAISARRRTNLAAWCFLLGTLLFSGSLYALTLTGHRKLGMITPIGGVLFIVGWIALAFAGLRTTDGEEPR